MQDVVASQVLRCSTDRHTRFIYLEPNLAPTSKRIEINPSLDQSLGQIFPLCLESVGPDIHRSLGLIGLNEFVAMSGAEQLEQHVDQFSIIAISVHDVCS